MRKRKDIPIDLLYLPALVLLAAFVLYPLISGIQISFTNWNGYSPRFKYVGLANYKKMFHDKMFYTALKNTLIYGIGSTTLQTVIGISYALLLQKKFHGQTLARVVIYLPAMIASLIMGYISYFLVQYNNGAINDVVKLFGGAPVDWMADGKRAVWIIVLINSLQNHDRDDRRTPGDPGVLRRGRGHRRGGLRAEAEAHHPAPAAARHHHQRDFKPDRGTEAVRNHPVHHKRRPGLFLPLPVHPDQLPVFPEPERGILGRGRDVYVPVYYGDQHVCAEFL